VEACQRAVSSREFTEWIAFWKLEAERSGAESERPPTQEELGAKIQAWAAAHNARETAKR
jgi:hypothetical protein